MVGGWDELVDTAVDGGLPRPAAQTRNELAALYDPEGRVQTRRLAVWADEAVFAHRPPADADGTAFWELVEAERDRMRGELGRWERVRAGLSLRSLRRRRATPPASASDGTGRRR